MYINSKIAFKYLIFDVIVLCLSIRYMKLYGSEINAFLLRHPVYIDMGWGGKDLLLICSKIPSAFPQPILNFL